MFSNFIEPYLTTCAISYLLYEKAFSLDQSKILLTVNPFPEDKISDWSKLKAFADKLNVTQNVKVVFHRIDNIVGKEEIAGYQHFLLFPQCFQKPFSSNALKIIIVW